MTVSRLLFFPPAFAYDAVMEAIGNGMRLILIITERIPRHDVAKFLLAAKEASCTVVGPNSVAILNPEDRIKLGAIGGDNVERCFVPGEVGVVSRSGGMTAECSWMVKRAGFGVSTSVSIGGDPLIGSSPKDIDGLIADAKRAKAYGFQGKIVIHPNQIQPCHDVFTPTEEEIGYAKKVIEAFEEAEREGRAAIQLEGRFIDYAVVAKSRRIVDLARAIAEED